jgi:hypothetical protein
VPSDLAGAAYPSFMAGASLSDVAKVAVDDFQRGTGGAITTVMARDLLTIVELALLTAVREERRGCAAECSRRAELWEKTAERSETTEQLRHEAQSRANEARYLADLIASRR